MLMTNGASAKGRETSFPMRHQLAQSPDPVDIGLFDFAGGPRSVIGESLADAGRRWGYRLYLPPHPRRKALSGSSDGARGRMGPRLRLLRLGPGFVLASAPHSVRPARHAVGDTFNEIRRRKSKHALQPEPPARKRDRWPTTVLDSVFSQAPPGAYEHLYIGDTSAFLAGVAPYFTIDPAAGMFNDPAVQGTARENSRYFNQAVMDQARAWMQQGGIAVDSAEFEFGLNAMRVVGAAYSAYSIGQDALSLALRNGNVRIVAQNNHVLRNFRNLSDQNIDDVARFVDDLSPQDFAGFDPRLRAAMIEGLERQSGNATARAALNRLRNFDSDAPGCRLASATSTRNRRWTCRRSGDAARKPGPWRGSRFAIASGAE